MTSMDAFFNYMEKQALLEEAVRLGVGTLKRAVGRFVSQRPILSALEKHAPNFAKTVEDKMPNTHGLLKDQAASVRSKAFDAAHPDTGGSQETVLHPKKPGDYKVGTDLAMQGAFTGLALYGGAKEGRAYANPSGSVSEYTSRFKQYI
jgi:hypothetical protein